MPTDMEICDFLKTAVNHIRSGWCQGLTRVSSSPGKTIAYSLYGALLASGKPSTSDHSLSANDRAIQTESIYLVGHQIPGANFHVWNDAPGRTQDEVIALIESIIDNISWLRQGDWKGYKKTS